MQSWYRKKVIELKAAYLAAMEVGDMEEAVRLHKEMETYEKMAK